MNNIKKLHIAGAIAVFIVGTLLHFTYDASGGSAAVALISSVNESIWEHLKLLFYPFLAFTIVEYFIYGREYKNFWPAKVFSVLAGMALIVISFYTYSGILGNHYLALDILTFILGITAAYVLSYKILNSGRYESKEARTAAMILLATTVAAFTMFTFRPPDIGLFADPLATALSTI